MESEQELRSALLSLDAVSRSVVISFDREALLRLDQLQGETQARDLFSSVAARVLQEKGFAPAALPDFLSTRGEELFTLAGRIVQRYRECGGTVNGFLERIFGPEAVAPAFSPQPAWSSPACPPPAAVQPPGSYIPEEPITTVGQSSGPPFATLLILLAAVVGVGTLMAFGGRIMMPFALLLAILATRWMLNNIFD
ncbi:MAG: hypothetical protein HY319_19140 [Armatimonadetes bacterium]|nr:hypothetical protein [Armatimonadota bacterium]